MKRRLIGILCLSIFLVQIVAPSNAADRKKPTWLSSCPEVVDATPQLATPKTMYLKSPSGQKFRLLATDSVEFAKEPQSIIGCYVFEENITNPNANPTWQIGVLNRDLQGFFFRNQAGVVWRLTLNTKTFTLETAPGSAYYSQGGGFVFDGVPLISPTPTPTPTSSKSTVAAAIKVGGSCPKIGQAGQVGKKVFTCSKLNGKNRWREATAAEKKVFLATKNSLPTPTPTVNPSASPTPLPTPTSLPTPNSTTALVGIRTAAIANNTYYQDRGNCHSRGINAELQALEAGNWKRLAGAMGWEDSTNCPVAQPVQPWVAMDIPAGTTLRWRFWLPGVFDLNSATFMSLTKKVQTNTSATPVPTPSATGTIRPSVTPTPSATATRPPTVLPTVAPIATPTPSATATRPPTVLPTVAPTPSAAATRAPTPTVAPTLSSQSPLLISNTTLTGIAGSTIMLTTSGGSGTGAVTFSVTGVGCSVSGALLGSVGVVTCVVTATKAASPGHSSSVSSPTAFTFGQQPLLVANTVRRVQAGIAIKLAFSGGSGTGSVYYSVTGSLCDVSTSDYKEWTLKAGGATTCSVTAKNNAALGYVTTTSAPAIFEFFKLDPPPLIAQTFTDTSFTKPTSPSTLYPIGTSIYIPVKNGGPTTYSVSGANCTTRNYVTGSGTYTAFTASVAATCVVVATFSGSAGFNPTTSAPISHVFGEFNQLPFSISGSQEVEGRARISVDQRGSGTGTITLSVSGANCSLVDGKVVASALTTCVVTATKAASPGYSAVTSAPVSITFKVSDQMPLLLAPAASTGNLVAVPIALSVSGGSGTGAVSYSVSGTSCSISGSNLVASSPTTCTITASKASSFWYNSISSTPVSYGFSVNNQSPLVLNHSPGLPLGTSPTGMQWPFTPNQQIYLSTSGGSGTGTVNYSVSGANCSLNQTVLTAAPALGTYTTCVVNATKAASPGYNATSAAPVSLIFGIYKQEPLFLPTWNPNFIGKRMDLPLSTTGGSGSGVVSYTVSGTCYIEQNRLKGGAPLGGSSTCTIVATKAGTPGRYDPISSAPVTIPLYNYLPRVDQSPLTLVTSSVPVGVKSITLSTSGGSGTGAVGYTLKSGNCVISGSTLSASASTSCVVNAYKLADVTYNLALSQTITFEFKLP